MCQHLATNIEFSLSFACLAILAGPLGTIVYELPRWCEMHTPFGCAAAALHSRVTRDFPHVTADSASLSSYSGFLHAGGSCFRVRVGGCGSLAAAGDEALRQILCNATPAARRRVAVAPDAHAALLELRAVIEHAVGLDASIAGASRGTHMAALPSASFYEGLLSEISVVGWECVAHMDETLRELALRIHDGGRREHVLSLKLPLSYPLDQPTTMASLPEQFVLSQWQRGSSGLADILQSFREAVDRFQPLFDALDDLDSKAWILEPERPLRSDVYRRIALGRHASLRIALDPRAPTRAVPECRFLGAESVVAPLRAKLNERMGMWDASGKVLPRANLECVLDLTLPPPLAIENAEQRDGSALVVASSQQDDMAMECGICYSYRLDDRVPEVACDRAECARPYHRTCLVEWLKALPDTKQSFETLFGACPYCEHHISVSMTVDK